MFNYFLILAGLVVAAGVARWLIRRTWGPLRGVCVELTPTTPRRTAGEVHRELWEQKGSLDRAVKETATATVANARKLQEAQATPLRGWHAPEAPCEVEP